MSFFPGHSESTKSLKNYENNSQGIIFVIISCQRVLYGIFWGHIFCKYGGWGWSELFSKVRREVLLGCFPGLELLKALEKSTPWSTFRALQARRPKLVGHFLSARTKRISTKVASRVLASVSLVKNTEKGPKILKFSKSTLRKCAEIDLVNGGGRGLKSVVKNVAIENAVIGGTKQKAPHLGSRVRKGSMCSCDSRCRVAMYRGYRWGQGLQNTAILGLCLDSLEGPKDRCDISFQTSKGTLLKTQTSLSRESRPFSWRQ